MTTAACAWLQYRIPGHTGRPSRLSPVRRPAPDTAQVQCRSSKTRPAEPRSREHEADIRPSTAPVRLSMTHGQLYYLAGGFVRSRQRTSYRCAAHLTALPGPPHAGTQPVRWNAAPGEGRAEPANHATVRPAHLRRARPSGRHQQVRTAWGRRDTEPGVNRRSCGAPPQPRGTTRGVGPCRWGGRRTPANDHSASAAGPKVAQAPQE